MHHFHSQGRLFYRQKLAEDDSSSSVQQEEDSLILPGFGVGAYSHLAALCGQALATLTSIDSFLDTIYLL